MPTRHRALVPNLPQLAGVVARCPDSDARGRPQTQQCGSRAFHDASGPETVRAGVDESDDLAAEVHNQGDILSVRLRPMLPPLAVACRYHFDRGNPIPFRIKAGMVLS